MKISSPSKSHADLQLAAGSVVGRDPNDVFGDFTINCGSLAGVSVGDAVITETGVVGVVEEVYAASSRVRSNFIRKRRRSAPRINHARKAASSQATSSSQTAAR